MSDKTEIITTKPQFDSLWQTYHSTRSSSKRVVVDKTAIFNVLRDHSTMSARLDDLDLLKSPKELES